MEKVSVRMQWFLVLVAALGYFVDIYDLILFSVVRIPSLKSLGLADQELLHTGIQILNLQMLGMLLGGVAFGMLGDKRGRIYVLFGSIFLYSAANIANAFVHDTFWYGVLRFVAGFGLAGELGAGITLVAETLPKNKRGIGTAIVASVGVSGALLAWEISHQLDWRTAYIVGGVLGLLLLTLRVGVLESKLFHSMQKAPVSRGNFFMLFQSKERFLRFLGCVLVGIPIWYVVGILVTLSPEFAIALSVTEPVEGGRAVYFAYMGFVVGDLLSGLFSQFLQSRKRSIFVFLALLSLGIAAYFSIRGRGAAEFYWVAFYLGCTSGYWAVFATVAAEQFGTNLRATVATSAPNFVRGSLVLVSAVFLALKPSLGILQAGAFVGIGVMALAFTGLYLLKESFATDLDFHER